MTKTVDKILFLFLPEIKKKEKIMSIKNFFGIKKFSPLFAEFMYFDTDEYLADSIFIKNNLRVHFYKGEFVSPDSKYIIIRCRIFIKNIDVFIKSMEELANKMLLTGHTDYVDFCNGIVGLLEENC